MPDNLDNTGYGLKSARLYFSMNADLTLTVNADGTVNAPEPDNSISTSSSSALTARQSDRQSEHRHDQRRPVWRSIQVTVNSSDLGSQPGTVGTAGLRDSVIQQYKTFTSDANDPYAICLWPTSSLKYGPYRILNPSGVLNEAQVATNKVLVETNLIGPISATETHIHVYCDGAFPTAFPYNVRIFNEIITVNGTVEHKDGTATWTVTRGADSTTAAAHANRALVRPGRAWDDRGTTDPDRNQHSRVSRYVPV